MDEQYSGVMDRDGYVRGSVTCYIANVSTCKALLIIHYARKRSMITLYGILVIVKDNLDALVGEL